MAMWPYGHMVIWRGLLDTLLVLDRYMARPGRSSHTATWRQNRPYGSKRLYCFTKANSKNRWILIGILLYFWKNQGCEVFFGQYCTGVSKKNFNKGSEFIWERPDWGLGLERPVWAGQVRIAIPPPNPDWQKSEKIASGAIQVAILVLYRYGGQNCRYFP